MIIVKRSENISITNANTIEGASIWFISRLALARKALPDCRILLLSEVSDVPDDKHSQTCATQKNNHSVHLFHKRRARLCINHLRKRNLLNMNKNYCNQVKFDVKISRNIFTNGVKSTLIRGKFFIIWLMSFGNSR